MARVIDSHAHLWRADDGFHDWLGEAGLERVNATFTAEQLGARTSLAGVDAVILVEGGAPAGQDTRMLLEQTRVSSRFAGVVAWIDLLAPDVDDELAQMRAAELGDRIVGFRTQVQAEDDSYLDRDDVREGLRAIARAGLPFDLVIRPSQRNSVLAALDALPDGLFVVDHLGSPDLEDGRPSRAWTGWMSDLAQRDNVVLKLSALHSAPGAGTDDGARELVTVALENLGAGRLAWGSDWPMSLLHRSYEQTVSFARSELSRLSADERAQVFGGTAERAYGLGGR